jgi:hypothetical protein
LVQKDEHPGVYFKTEEIESSSIDSSIYSPTAFDGDALKSPVRNYDSFVEESNKLSKISYATLLTTDDEFVRDLLKQE